MSDPGASSPSESGSCRTGRASTSSRTRAGKALYVGKAKSLRKRVVSYLGGSPEPRIAAMLAEAADLDFLVTDSEAEALLLENNWIKRRKPRFNVLLRDDKTYPYLKLTAGPWPRIAFTRRIRNDGAEYFGPYLPGGLARKAIKLVQKLFEIRVCRIEIDGSLPRPCLYYDMHRCLGPCVDGLTTPAAYGDAVAAARLFLAGRSARAGPPAQARDAAGVRGARVRAGGAAARPVAEVEAVSRRGKLSSVRGEDVDIYGAKVAGGNAAVTVLVMRGGQVLDRRELFWEGRQGISEAAVLSELLPQIYDRTTFIPKEIHLPVPIEGDEALSQWLSERKGERVYLRLPAQGPQGAAGGARPAQRRAGVPPPVPPRRRRRPGRRRWPSGSGWPSRRGASRASTSPTSRATRRWPRWSSGRRAGCARATTAASTSAASTAPTTSSRCARR